MEQTKEPQKKTEGQANAGLEGADIWGEDNDPMGEVNAMTE